MNFEATHKNSLTSGIIGEFRLDDVQLYFLRNVKNPKKIILQVSLFSDVDLEALKKQETFFTSVLHDGNIFVAFKNTSGHTNFQILDRNGSILRLRKNAILSSTSVFKVKPVESLVYVFTQIGDTFIRQRLCLLDYNLNTLHEINVDQTFSNLATFKQDLFVMSCQGNNTFQTLTSYNPNLETVVKVGQGNEILPFYFSKSITMFLVNDQYYFVLGDNLNALFGGCAITLIDRSNGHVQKSFSIQQTTSWSLYLDKYILSFDKNFNIFNKYFNTYDLNGKNRTGFSDNFFTEKHLNSVWNKELYFLDHSNLTFYAI